MLSERIQEPVAFAVSAVASETDLDRIDELLITERLREKLYGTALHRLHGHRDVAVSRYEDDWEISVCLHKLALKLKSASTGQSHIQHQANRTVREIAL